MQTGDGCNMEGPPPTGACWRRGRPGSSVFLVTASYRPGCMAVPCWPTFTMVRPQCAIRTGCCARQGGLGRGEVSMGRQVVLMASSPKKKSEKGSESGVQDGGEQSQGFAERLPGIGTGRAEAR
jgi:hypothetical protein